MVGCARIVTQVRASASEPTPARSMSTCAMPSSSYGCGRRAKAQRRVEALETLLRRDAHRPSRPDAAGAREALGHQRSAEADPAIRRNRQHAADRWFRKFAARIEHPQVARENRRRGAERPTRRDARRGGHGRRRPGMRNAARPRTPAAARRARHRARRARESAKPRPLPSDLRCEARERDVRRGIHRAEHSAVGSSRRGCGDCRGRCEIVGERAAHRARR